MDSSHASITLTVGARQIDRILPDAVALLRQYRAITGCYFLDYQSITPADQVVPEDLAVTLLINSQAGWRAFLSLQQHGSSIELGGLPQKPLEHTLPEEFQQVAALITQVAQFPGFAASLATKVLHKKRPDLIPILDNQAIFGAYMNPDWPEKPAYSYSVKDENSIRKALDWIAFDVSRPENEDAWAELNAIEPARSRIQLFDGVWWMHFRNTQPVARSR